MTFLILTPLLFGMIVGGVQITDTVTTSDINVQENIASACKAAAYQVCDASQANETPRIDSANALNEFEVSLEENLGLSSTLTPLPSSHYQGAPEFWLLVYNGYSDFSTEGADLYDYWNYDGSLPPSSLSMIGTPSGFPATFYVTNSGINTTSGTYAVTLDSPGVIAVVQMQATNVMGGGANTVNRWASARIVCEGGTCNVNN